MIKNQINNRKNKNVHQDESATISDYYNSKNEISSLNLLTMSKNTKLKNDCQISISSIVFNDTDDHDENHDDANDLDSLD